MVGYVPLGFHGLGGSAEKGTVTLAPDDGEIFGAGGLLKNDLGEVLFRGGKFFPGGDALGFLQTLLDQFRSTGLDGKIRLGEGNFLLLRVAILGDEVAGIPGEHDVFDLALGARTDFDHFVDVNKMVCHSMTRHFAGGFRFGGDLEEVPPFRVAEEVLEVTGQPIFHAVFRPLGVSLERAGQGENSVGFHRASFTAKINCRHVLRGREKPVPETVPRTPHGHSLAFSRARSLFSSCFGERCEISQHSDH